MITEETAKLILNVSVIVLVIFVFLPTPKTQKGAFIQILFGGPFAWVIFLIMYAFHVYRRKVHGIKRVW